MAASRVYILGGYQSDFARNLTREGLCVADLLTETTRGVLANCQLTAKDIDTAHVGNFVGELLNDQGHLGALLAESDPDLIGLPTMRHEAACASGGLATLSGMAEIEAGRYQVALVVGIEVMRGRGTFEAQSRLGVGAWTPFDTAGATHPWPTLFNQLAAAYQERFGLDYQHLVALAANHFSNARRNPLAQTRSWQFPEGAFTCDDSLNPVIAGMLRKQDCSQITDGSVGVILASAAFATAYCAKRGRKLEDLAYISGWGHRSGRMRFRDSLPGNTPYILPAIRGAIVDAFARAQIPDVSAIDAIECHDCFSISAYASIDHFGLTAPGESYRAIEDGTIAFDGTCPMNPSGGLIGAGHPVGATGVRMLLDATRQVTETAGDYQVAEANRVAVLNMGGCAATTVAFVVETEHL